MFKTGSADGCYEVEGENVMLKVEPYWQWLFDVPVEQGTTYSIINHNMFFQDRLLTNDGAAR